MRRRVTPGTILATLAALGTMVAAWFIPLPQISSGEEQLAPQRLPELRVEVENARQVFGLAQDRYRDYIASNDMGALLITTRQRIANAKSNPQDLDRKLAVREAALQIAGYTTELENYARSAERYFDTLRRYDDDLMAWTRSLRAGGEALRDETWPIVEHLKFYPEPVGLKTDPPVISAADVTSYSMALQLHVITLTTEAAVGGPDNDGQGLLTSIEQDVADIWEAGRSIEYVAGLHAQYDSFLAGYDEKVQATVSGAENAGQTGGRLLVAGGLNLLVGLILFIGLTAIYLPRREAAT